MTAHEFWRNRGDRRVYAVELVDGVVARTYGPLQPEEIEERFLAGFDYSTDDTDRIERHRDEFELHDPVAAFDLDEPRRPTFGGRRVSDVMHPGVLTCHSASTLHDVARSMATHGVHAVAIWGDEGQDSVGFLGMVSALDLLTAAMHGHSLATPAIVAARTDVHAVRASAPLTEGARLMVDERASHLIVLDDHQDRIVGVLSALDVTRALTLP